MDTALITGSITIIVALLGVFGNWYLSNQNKKKELEQKEYQFLLENLKSFWENQNRLYTETLKVVSTLVLNDKTDSDEFQLAYKRFWELYWSELPTCESHEVEGAMVSIKDLIYDKKHMNPAEWAKSPELKHDMKEKLLDLSQAIRNSSLLLEYSENLKIKIRNGIAQKGIDE